MSLGREGRLFFHEARIEHGNQMLSKEIKMKCTNELASRGNFNSESTTKINTIKNHLFTCWPTSRIHERFDRIKYTCDTSIQVQRVHNR
eukprot:TRINITY_DN10800_c0_g2_i1.p1 TRINITY_DN10800_c0_g2~~TRINITY_DN10800_c0_g2_i1.p1  ORF type:complete len:103 (-),score=9.83 TRINITY_DN10800_c0_g2_i1:33-299(-)